MRMRLLVMLAAFAPSTGSAQAASPPEVVDAFHDALASRDSSAAVGYLTDDVMIFESGGVERSREEYAGHHLGSDMVFAAATSRTVLTRTDHAFGDVAVVMTTSRTTGTFRDRAIDAQGAETMILRNMADGWRIMHIHWSSRR